MLPLHAATTMHAVWWPRCGGADEVDGILGVRRSQDHDAVTGVPPPPPSDAPTHTPESLRNASAVAHISQAVLTAEPSSVTMSPGSHSQPSSPAPGGEPGKIRSGWPNWRLRSGAAGSECEAVPVGQLRAAPRARATVPPRSDEDGVHAAVGRAEQPTGGAGAGAGGDQPSGRPGPRRAAPLHAADPGVNALPL